VSLNFYVIRLLAFLKKNVGAAKKVYKLYNGKTRCFDDLVDHYSHIGGMQILTNGSKRLALALTSTKLFSTVESSYENILHLYGIWFSNYYFLRNAYDSVVGCAIYISPTAFGYSCRPNAVQILDENFRVQIRCIHNIFIGVTPTVSLSSNICEKSKRYETLAMRLYYNCKCMVCGMERYEPVINYVELNERRAQLEMKNVYTDSDFECAMDILKNMRKIYHQYDERITNFYEFNLEKLLCTLDGPHGKMLSPSYVKAFAEQTEENLRMTYGVKHKNYRHYVEKLYPKVLNIK
ncbi:hypothetical protein Bhyg_15674, partial [Pseudolycoriella hygida]